MTENEGSVNQKKYPFRKDHFKEQTLVIGLSGFELERSNEDLFKFSSATKNISTLSYFIDSLRNINELKKNAYLNEFNTVHLYSQRNFYTPDVIVNGSSSNTSLPVFKPWVIFDTLSQDEKKDVVSRAIEYARFSLNYITQKKEFIHNDIRNLRNYQIEYHKKFTLSLACIVFLLIGAPLGAIIRKGGLGTPAVISVLFFVIYYIISISFEKLARENHIDIFTGMWAAFIILFPIGVFLTWKASTDSSLFDVETYTLFFKKIKNKLYRLIFNVKYEDTLEEE